MLYKKRNPSMLGLAGRNNMVNNKLYSGFFNYIHYLHEKHGVWITIKDRVNLLSYLDKPLASALVPYLGHQNCYCNYIKSKGNSFKKCIYMLDKIDDKCKSKRQPFWGVCHAGVCEYVAPVFSMQDEYLGFITLGPFEYDQGVIKKRLEHFCRNEDENYDTIKQMYLSLPKLSGYDPKEIHILAGILVEYIANLYPGNKNGSETGGVKRSGFKENMVLDKLLTCLNENYNEHNDLKKLAEICNCSKSYISHMFKKETGLSLSMYITYIRINETKKKLLETTDSITQIALSAGFSDSNYFSKVFRRLNGITPKEYRNKLSN